MKRDSLLVVGLGQCGCTLTDLLKKVNNRYSTLYINSSIGDIKDLEYKNMDNNVFIFSGVDGAGRNRNKAKSFVESDKIRLASFMKNFSQFKYMLIFTSFGGGTGSGSLTDFIEICKTVMPSTLINLVGVLPSLKENKLELKNTLACLSDMNEVSHLLNDIKFINNDKGEDYNEINSKAIRDIDLAYGMTAHSKIGSIDEDNLTNVTTCKGYGVILKLDLNSDGILDSIEQAMKDSVFEIPNKLDGLYGAINVFDTYSVKDIRESIDVKQTLYMAYGKKNVLCIGGCSFPDTCIDNIEATLKEKELRDDTKENRVFSFKSKYNTEIVTNKEHEIKTNDYIDDDDIDKLFNQENYNF